jgi:hypothetical protein
VLVSIVKVDIAAASNRPAPQQPVPQSRQLADNLEH